jgi:hypothetical protein
MQNDEENLQSVSYHSPISLQFSWTAFQAVYSDEI